MRILGKALIGLLAVLGLIAIIVFGGTWLLVRDFATTSPMTKADLPDRFLLHLPLEAPFPEKDPALPFLSLADRTPSLRNAVAAIDAAATDPRVVGLIATVAQSGRSLAQAQEVRAAIARFREAGKPTLAFADTLGEGGSATVDYYLASGFDEVILQPSGMIGLTGFASEVPFAASALKDLGIDAEFGKRWEYKNAGDSLIRDDMSNAQRASLTSLMSNLQDQAATGIAKGRSLPVDAVRERLNGLPLMAETAHAAGLVDSLGYWRDALTSVAAKAGTDTTVALPRYAAHAQPDTAGSDQKIALVQVVGTIHRGESEDTAFSDQGAGGDSVAYALRQAVDDKDVRAIVLRIDSPGGSYVASDTIWNEVRRARERNIPVIASMGGVAASGGYFAAMGADRIIARPGTITGSIGVFAGKPVLSRLWDKLGVTWEGVAAGKHALMWSANRPFTDTERQWFQGMLDAIYKDFTGKVAEARDLSPEALDAAARGRVFTGEQAVKVGLVDALGGLPEAIAEARERGTAPDANVVLFPKRKTAVEEVMDLLDDGRFLEAATTLGHLAALAKPLTAELARARVSAEGPAMLAPRALP